MDLRNRGLQVTPTVTNLIPASPEHRNQSVEFSYKVHLQGTKVLTHLRAMPTLLVMPCTICYHLHNLENVKKPME